MSRPPVLEVEEVAVSFGGVRALGGVNFRVNSGERVGLIGANGSGKSTLLNVVTGELRPQAGRVRVNGVETTGRSPAEVARRGIARVFQAVEVFPRLSLLDNLLTARSHAGEGLLAVCRPRVGGDDGPVRRAWQLLEFLGLESVAHREARHLSYGQQRLLEIGMSLMADPVLLLLDEPTAGLNPGMRERVVGALREISGRATALVIVEHEVSVVFALAERVVVLDAGEVLAEGTPAEIRANTAVVQAYLGRVATP